MIIAAERVDFWNSHHHYDEYYFIVRFDKYIYRNNVSKYYYIINKIGGTKMNKFIKIGMILAVLLSMVGLTSASDPNVVDGMTVNIALNTEAHYQITYAPSILDVTELAFAIFEQAGNGEWTIPTTEIEGQLEGGTWATALNPSTEGVTTSVVDGAGLGTWSFSIRDKDPTNSNENDAQQVNKQYMVYFYADTVPILQSHTGVVTSIVDTEIPEFPTIALPVAAILGLAFIFQRRREED